MSATVSPRTALETIQTPEFQAAQNLAAKLATPKDVASGVKVSEAI